MALVMVVVLAGCGDDGRAPADAGDPDGSQDATGVDAGDGCFTDDDCSTGLQCYDRRGSCDRPGECVSPECEGSVGLDPVCGCDGNTYDHPCRAHVAGVAIRHEGECTDGG